MFKKLCMRAYRFVLLAIVVYAFHCYTIAGWNAVFHESAYYIPIAMMFLMFSGQADLLEKIKRGEMVNIKARVIDFVHWFLLTFMLVGRWDVGGITIWAFLLNVVLLSIIGWQIGVGVGQQWFPTRKEKQLGIITLTAAVLLGLIAGKIRILDSALFGWGWAFEVLTAVISTFIVIWWIINDISVIKHKAFGYPRSFFLKGILNNALGVWVLAHLIISYPGDGAWTSNAGIAFNVIVGNAIYLVYYLTWEYHYARQLKHAN